MSYKSLEAIYQLYRAQDITHAEEREPRHLTDMGSLPSAEEAWESLQESNPDTPHPIPPEQEPEGLFGELYEAIVADTSFMVMLGLDEEDWLFPWGEESERLASVCNVSAFPQLADERDFLFQLGETSLMLQPWNVLYLTEQELERAHFVGRISDSDRTLLQQELKLDLRLLERRRSQPSWFAKTPLGQTQGIRSGSSTSLSLAAMELPVERRGAPCEEDSNAPIARFHRDEARKTKPWTDRIHRPVVGGEASTLFLPVTWSSSISGLVSGWASSLENHAGQHASEQEREARLVYNADARLRVKRTKSPRQFLIVLDRAVTESEHVRLLLDGEVIYSGRPLRQFLLHLYDGDGAQSINLSRLSESLSWEGD